MRANTQTHKGSRTQEGRKKTVGNRHEISGRERGGVRVHRVNKMDTTGTFEVLT